MASAPIACWNSPRSLTWQAPRAGDDPRVFLRSQVLRGTPSAVRKGDVDKLYSSAESRRGQDEYSGDSFRGRTVNSGGFGAGARPQFGPDPFRQTEGVPPDVKAGEVCQSDEIAHDDLRGRGQIARRLSDSTARELNSHCSRHHKKRVVFVPRANQRRPEPKVQDRRTEVQVPRPRRHQIPSWQLRVEVDEKGDGGKGRSDGDNTQQEDAPRAKLSRRPIDQADDHQENHRLNDSFVPPVQRGERAFHLWRGTSVGEAGSYLENCGEEVDDYIKQNKRIPPVGAAEQGRDDRQLKR